MSNATTGVRLVSPAEVARARSEGRPFALVDVRTPAEYEQFHAEGADLVPLDRLDPRAFVASRGSKGEEPIFLLCRSGARAAKACEAFCAAGFANVVCVEGGTEAWQRAGLPVVQGERKVISLERQVRLAAGTLVLLGVVLGWLVHPALLGLSAFVGAGLVFSGVTDWCGMAMLLSRMPWNQASTGSNPGCGAKVA